MVLLCQYIKAKGIQDYLINKTNSSALFPYESNDTEEGRAKKRRVEIGLVR